jgi:predicted esterase YcpF (UPF0227 family)
MDLGSREQFQDWLLGQPDEEESTLEQQAITNVSSVTVSEAENPEVNQLSSPVQDKKFDMQAMMINFQKMVESIKEDQKEQLRQLFQQSDEKAQERFNSFKASQEKASQDQRELIKSLKQEQVKARQDLERVEQDRIKARQEIVKLKEEMKKIIQECQRFRDQLFKELSAKITEDQEQRKEEISQFGGKFRKGEIRALQGQ